eukprot:CAMPEP_0183442064 /NCGR_PEP_ID=MMETSP0370-20130417/86870_1 /TAXON_ID=268820 /ORGANISM="Peridinium aciculiferum, Strain PAER-2" /LENGTH=426 /DNA_ID=CAMNT_0025631523 /DNA_START=41 /DNA_END=1321 /DNA_ORIENTATION=+
MVRRTASSLPVGLPVIAAAAVAGTALVRCLVFVDPLRLSPRLLRLARHAKPNPKLGERSWAEAVGNPYDMQNNAAIEDDDGGILGDPLLKPLQRDVKVTDQRDVNELLRLRNPCRPTEEMWLYAITMHDGTRIEYPKRDQLAKLQITERQPVIFTWRDRSQYQTRAPKFYDDIISRLLNAGPAEMEDLVRSNWKQFDQGFYFRLTELQEDTDDMRLLERLRNLQKITMKLIEQARLEASKKTPDHGENVKEMIKTMLEDDTLLWPPKPESYQKLAETITKLSTRNSHENMWYENVIEVLERFGKKMDVQGKKQMNGMAQVIMQRLITEWLRNDNLWEETDEGRFIFRMMSISHEQWPVQLAYEKAPLDATKLRDELKIISETKIVSLPMGSKLQMYAAKYIQGVVEFFSKNEGRLQAGQGEVMTPR